METSAGVEVAGSREQAVQLLETAGSSSFRQEATVPTVMGAVM